MSHFFVSWVITVYGEMKTCIILHAHIGAESTMCLNMTYDPWARFSKLLKKILGKS